MEEESAMVLEKIMSDMQYELTSERSLNAKLQEEVRSFRSRMEELNQEKVELQDFFETSLKSSKDEVLEVETKLKTTKQELFECKCELKEMIEVSKGDLQQLNNLSIEHEKFMKRLREVEKENRRLQTQMEQQDVSMQAAHTEDALANLEQTLSKIREHVAQDEVHRHAKKSGAERLQAELVKSRAAMGQAEVAARAIRREADEMLIASDGIKRELFASSLHRIEELEVLLADLRLKEERVAELESTCSAAETDLAENKLQLESLQEKLNIATSQLDKQLKRAREAECKLAGETIRAKKMEEQARMEMEEKNAEIRRLKEEVEEKVKEEKDQRRLEVERAEREESARREHEEKIKEQDEQIKELLERRRQGQEKIRQLELKMKEQDDLVTELEEKIEEVDGERQKLEEKLREQEEARQEELEKMRELVEKVRVQEQLITGLVEEKDKVQQDLEGVRQEEQQVRRELERREEEEENNREELQQKIRELDKLHQEVRAQETTRKEREEERRDLIREVERLQEKSAELEDRLRREEMKCREVEEQGGRELEGRIKELQEMESMLKDSRERRDEEVKALSKHVEELQACRSELISEVERMKELVEVRTGEKEEAMKSLHSLQHEMNEMRERNSAVCSTPTGQQEQQTVASLQVAEQKISNLTAEARALTDKLEALESERDEQRLAISTLEEERRHMRQAMKANDKTLDALDKVLLEVEANLDDLEQRQFVISTWINQTRNESENRETVIHSMEENYKHIVNRCNMLELTMKSMEMEKETLSFENHDIKDKLEKSSFEKSMLIKCLENAEKISWILLQEIENTTEDVETIFLSLQGSLDEGENSLISKSDQELLQQVQLLEVVAESMSNTSEAILSSIKETVGVMSRRRALDTSDAADVRRSHAQQGAAEDLDGQPPTDRNSEISGLRKEIENLRENLGAAESSRISLIQQNEQLKQSFYTKQKEHLDRLKLERAKVAEEMSSAFKELTTRQEKLDLLSSVLSCITAKDSILLEECRGKRLLAPAADQRLQELITEEGQLRTQLAALDAQSTNSSTVFQEPLKKTPAKGVLKRNSIESDNAMNSTSVLEDQTVSERKRVAFAESTDDHEFEDVLVEMHDVDSVSL
uniref:GAT domain-containing protein n=1 Tax=Guillardia theta TaxID=55529 RepID=A0A7S4KMM4_GUITH